MTFKVKFYGGRIVENLLCIITKTQFVYYLKKIKKYHPL